MNRFYEITVSDISRQTPDSVSIELFIPESLYETFRFVQGQHITVRMNYKGEEIRRSYSLCSSPYENKWKIGVKKIPSGIFSTFANETLKVEDTLQVSPPQGRFYTELNTMNDKHYVAFAAGSGITPILSTIKAVLIKEPKSSFTLFYGNRSRQSIMFLEELEDLKNKHMSRLAVYYIMSKEMQDAKFLNGRINQEKFEAIFHSILPVESIDEVFLCGPKEMIFSGKSVLERFNFPTQNIHFELFYNGETPKHKSSKKSTNQDLKNIVIVLNGRKIQYKASSDENILDGALQRGADLPFACKGGVCSTCKAKLVEGDVDMLVNYALEKDEIDNGFILTCQSHPISPTILVDFDV